MISPDCYGYYLAGFDEHHGNMRLAMQAEDAWLSLGHGAPSKQCGVSIWIQDGVQTVRAVVRDLFANTVVQRPGCERYELPKHHVLTLPLHGPVSDRVDAQSKEGK